MSPSDGGRRPSAPWRPDDLVRLATMSLVALVGIGIAWYGAAGRGRLAQQTSWLNLAVVAIALAGAANLQWLARGRRAVGLRRRDLLARWEGPDVAPVLAARPAAGRVRAPGMAFAHRPSCPLLAGKAIEAIEDPGAAACAICCPDPMT